tara:strand:- start:3727 stop:5436 length:1710 start_codon:yes stop_codon:yes gene_type:complete
MADNNKAYLNNPNLPRAGAEHEYDAQMLKELKKCGKNIVHFAQKYFYIVDPDKGKRVIKLYKPQLKILKQLQDNRFNIVLASRQTGKSTLFTIYAMWVACFQADKKILLVANKESTAIQLFQRMRMAYEQLPNWLKPGVKEWGKTSMTLENDSGIGISTTTGSAARGSSCNVLILDELAFIENHLVDEFWKSVYPIISASKTSKILIASTPNGTDNLYYKLWSGAIAGTNGWSPGQMHWSEIPGRDEMWVKQTKASLDSAEAWAQEFDLEFIQGGQSAIDLDYFNILKAKCRKPTLSLDDGKYNLWATPDSERLYVIGVDTGEGVGQDASVMQILDITDLRDIKQVAVYKSNRISPYEYVTRVKEIAAHWGNPLLLIERNNQGAQIIDRLANDEQYENIVSYGASKANRRKGHYGMVSHTNTKYQAVMNSRYWINELKCVEFNDMETVNELKAFTKHANGTWKAKDGFHDDNVMALIWALMILEKEITERFFTIDEFDENKKPQLITMMDYGIRYFEDPTSIYTETPTGESESYNTMPGIFSGGEDQGYDEMGMLMGMGYTPLIDSYNK